MLVLPLWTICAVSLVSIFSPLLKELQEPSIALLQSASGASLDCVKIIFGDWLQISSMGDVGRLDTTRPPPSGTIRSSPVIVYLPSSTNSIVLSPPWNGTNDYILIPTESSLATITQSINSLSLVTPFKVYPPRFPPPHPRIFERGSAVDGAGETGSELPVVVSNDFLALVAATFLTFHLMVYVSWKMKLAKERQSAEKKETAKQMEDLRKTKFVLGKQKESYLKGVLDDIDKISKESEASVDPQITILEHLYIEGDSSSAEPKLFSVKRWTIAKSEFDSTYVWRTVPRVPSVDPSTVVSQFPVEVASPGVVIGEREQFRVHKRPKGLITTGAPKRIVSSSRPKPLARKSDSDIGGQESVERPAVANDVQSEARQSNNGGLPQSSKGSTERASTVVSDIHVERPSDPERPSVTRATVDRQASPESPSVMVDIQAEGTADMDLRQGKVADIRSSTSVDILVEGASTSERPPAPTDQEPPATSPAVVDIPTAVGTSTDLRQGKVADIRSSTSVDILVEGASNPATPSLVTVTTAAAADPNTNTVEPSTTVDIHVEGTPVVTEEPSGSASIDTGASVSDTPTVVADNSKDQGDGYESSTSVRTAILAAPTDSLPAAAMATATTTTTTAIQAEASSVSEEATPSPARRRKNRMGQRQRRKLREMRENRPPQSADEPEEGSKG